MNRETENLREVTTQVARAAVVTTGVWAWFAAQWLTNGLSDHAHVGGAIGQHHHWAGAGLATSGALMFALWAVFAILAVRHGLDTEAWSRQSHRGESALAALAVAAYAALELVEQLIQPEHRSPATLLVMALGLVVTGATVAVAALLACALVVGIGSLLHLFVHHVSAPQRPLRASASSIAFRPRTSLLHATSQQRRGPPTAVLLAA